MCNRLLTGGPKKEEKGILRGLELSHVKHTFGLS